MSSFISRFRPFIYAILAIGLIETIILFTVQPNPATRNNFLSLAYPDQEKFGRAIIYEKVKYFIQKNPEIIQIGDSSGLMGIRGNVVEEYLPEGVTYANLSCCTTVGYRGPLGLMKYFITHNPNLKMVVLHNSPAGNLPSYFNEISEGDEHRSLGNDIYDQYVGWRRWLGIPSLSLRKRVVTEAYYRFPYAVSSAEFDPYRPITSHKSFLQLMKDLPTNRGYMADPESQLGQFGIWGPMKECQIDVRPYPNPLFGKKHASYIEKTYSAFAELARKHDIKLMIVHQVMLCPRGTGKGSQTARDAIKRFQNKYPEVIIPFDVVEYWPPEKFAVPAHVRDRHTVELSHRLGVEVGKAYGAQ